MKVTLNINLPSTVKEDYNSTKNLSKKRELLSSQSCQKRGSYSPHKVVKREGATLFITTLLPDPSVLSC